jgi:O-acetyl-ADP-ribose deacetylase (regulator of RNase III)
MRVPQNVQWDREVVYDCTWSLLCEVGRHNRAIRDGSLCHVPEIESILITPLATGVGQVSPDRWAGQFVLALKHWVDAEQNADKWNSLGWGTIYQYHHEVVQTYKKELSRGRLAGDV